MGTLFYLILLILSWEFISSTNTEAQEIKSARLLDLLIRDYTFKSIGDRFMKTGIMQSVRLPGNFSTIEVDTVKLRCGSLSRYGAEIKEFHLGIGSILQPCAERVMLIRQNLGFNWSSIYYSNYNLSGYQLVSPVLALLAYNSGFNDVNFSNPFEMSIISGEIPITIDFRNSTAISESESESEPQSKPMCAWFEEDGRVTLKTEVSPYVCAAKRDGHYGLVMEPPEKGTSAPAPAPMEVGERKKVSKWKMVVGSSIGTVIGASLLGLLLVAMLVNGKKKAKREELERRAYEEEVLQVSMVGHVRAPNASCSRTTPNNQHR